ncbi:MAG: hypothetical protein ACREXX_14585 [Gammaproteobacteria bacterium]
MRLNDAVYRVLCDRGEHVGNLKWIGGKEHGGVWKFKAIGHDAEGRVIPGGGPLTDRHDTVFTSPDERDLCVRLLGL